MKQNSTMHLNVEQEQAPTSVSLKPSIWLLVLIVGLPLLSETVYSPALPDIANALFVSDSMVEYTLTIYLLGFAIGTFFWGNLSDKWGRKPCLLVGLLIYLVGCVGCYLSDSITGLMVSRLIQAIGGSSGSVLGQAIARDAFHGNSLGKIYATVGTALAIFPAAGPIIGGSIDQKFGWSTIFLFLIGCAVVVLALTAKTLPETHPHQSRQRVSMSGTFLRMMQDRQVVGFCLLIAAGNGMAFSYYAEGPFIMIELLGLTPSQYGLTFLGIATASFTGGLINRRLHNTHSSMEILNYGLVLILTGSAFLVGFVSLVQDPTILVFGILVSMMILLGGNVLAINNSLSMSLMNYKNCIGTASSLFGFSYYVLIALVTLGMGYIHTHTLFPMPIYFMGIAVFMVLVRKLLIKGE